MLTQDVLLTHRKLIVCTLFGVLAKHPVLASRQLFQFYFGRIALIAFRLVPGTTIDSTLNEIFTTARETTAYFADPSRDHRFGRGGYVAGSGRANPQQGKA